MLLFFPCRQLDAEKTDVERTTMLLQIFGLTSTPTWWRLNRIPLGGGSELTLILSNAVKQSRSMHFFIGQQPLDTLSTTQLTEFWADGVGHIVAKPADSIQGPEPDSRLRLITTAGPDAGRIIPLTRRVLSVGRGSSRVQVRDPWLSAHDFDVQLSSNGTLITPLGGTPSFWDTDTQYAAGTSRFQLNRGSTKPLNIPSYPGNFVITPGQPPSPPNVVLQVVGAAAPLMIGVVLMLMTGMWYFLLFSGISVIIATVLMTQYRRARRRYVGDIEAALAHTKQRFQHCAYRPHELALAITSSGPDPISVQGPQPKYPVLNFGTAIRKAVIEQVQNTERWDDYLSDRVSVVLSLQPGARTIVVGDSTARRALQNWCIAQLLRHARATNTAITVDGEHFGGSRVVAVISENLSPASEGTHQLVFTESTLVRPDEGTVIVDLDRHKITGDVSATGLEFLGVSSSTLKWIVKELRIDQPAKTQTLAHLALSQKTMQGVAREELYTPLGAGPLGLSIDLVSQGPHILIAGTTGSGKSELLLTVLAGVAERYPPTEVSMILLDFKGGSSFNVLSPLPHTMSVETNHIAATSFRSLEAIAAELFRRESLFAEHQVADYVTYRRQMPHAVLPRLVVAIDELRVLVDQNTGAATTLAHLAATGRSLGFHLVLATQRTQGAVNADIRANIGSSISLRTATEHDSWDVLGTADAAKISPADPGRAFFKAGAQQPQEFQTSRYVLDDEPIVFVPDGDSAQALMPSTTDWAALTIQLQERARGLPIPQRAILPALSDSVSTTALHAEHGPFHGFTAIGLVDDAARCRQYPVWLGSKPATDSALVLSSSVAWIGVANSGIETSAQVVSGHVQSSGRHSILLDGSHVPTDSGPWDKYLHISHATADVLQQFMEELRSLLAAQTDTTIVIKDWGSWADALVTGSFHGFEELLIHALRQYSAVLIIYVFGARELAGGRLIGMIPDRFYLPMNSSAEHQMIWPKLRSVPTVAARAVLVTAECAVGGYEVQLSKA